MSSTLAIFRRELVARRDLLLVAAAAAVIAILMPLLPGLGAYDPADVRDVSSSALALALGWGLAIGLGAAIFGSDLSAGRLGFFFARPVKGLAVWVGRSAAALALVFATEVLVVLPALLGGGSAGSSLGVADGWPLAIAFLGVPVLLFLAAHAASVMVRARTAWLFLDLVGIVVAGVVGWVTLRPLLWMGAESASWVIAGALLAALVFALVTGGAVATVAGRCDLRRTHAALSITLWSVLAVTIGAVGAYAGWLQSFKPADVDRVELLSVSPTGEWVEAFGSAPGRLDVRRRFLISTTDDRWLALPHQALWSWKTIVFSIDGRHAAWLAQGRGEEPRAIRYVALDGLELETVSTKILVPPGTGFELSPDGTQMAFVEDEILSVYELTGERLVTAVRLPEDLHGSTMFFLDGDTIRLYGRASEREGHAIRIADVRVPSGEIVRTGEIAGPPDRFWTAFDSGVENMVIGWRAEGPDHGMRNMYNARSGEFIRTLAGGFPYLLSNGRMATLREEDDGREWLIVESLDGAQHTEYDLGVGVEAKLGGEALPGELVVLRLADPSVWSEGRRADLIDLDAGSWRPVAVGVDRVRAGFRWMSGAIGTSFWFVDQPAADRLLTDRTGALVRWDPDTGDLIHIVGGRN